MRSVSILVFCVVLAGCVPGSPTPESEPDFFAKTEQSVRDRLIKAHIHAVDSLNLSEFELFESHLMRGGEDALYVFDWGIGKLAVFDKNFEDDSVFIGKGKGEGPGEVRGINDMDVHDGKIYLFSGMRVIVWSGSGELLSDKTMEVEAYRGEVVDEGKVVIMAPTSSRYLFNIVDAEGKVERGFVKTDLGKVTPLHYAGDLAFDGQYLYYAGQPESLIKKYTLEGRQVYSVATIDNYPSEVNYVQFEASGGQRAMGYAPGALFSTALIEVYDGYLLAVPIHDYDQTTLSYIDVYAAGEGRYLATYDLARMPQALAVDAGGIYTLEYEGGDAYLKRYRNFLADLEASRAEAP